MLRPIGRCAQSLNPQCSQSHFRPLRRNSPLPPAPTSQTQALKPCIVTWVELFHQRRHCAGDGVSSNEQVISQISPWTFETYIENNNKNKIIKVILLDYKYYNIIGIFWTKYPGYHAAAVIPWAKASWTSPPTPMSESWGVWVGVVTAESEWMGVGMGRLMVWLGEERGEPGPWVCDAENIY